MELQFKEADTEKQLLAVETATKKRRAAKTVEALEDAFRRLADLKWTDADWLDAKRVQSALQSGQLKRVDDSKRLSKKEIAELLARLNELEREARIQALVDGAPDNYRVITDMKQFKQFIDDLYCESLVSVDTETTGLDLFEDRIVGYSVWLPNADYGAYVPFAHGDTVGDSLPSYGTIPSYKRFDGQLDADTALENIREYLEDPSHKTIWQNGRFDFHMFANHGIRCADPYFDTQVGAHELNENESHRLKDLAPRYLGIESDHFGELWGNDPKIYDKPVHPSGIYAIKDTELTYKLYLFQRQHIDARQGLKYDFWTIQMPQVRISFEMERTGFALDLEACKQLDERLQGEVDEDMRSLADRLGVDDQLLQRMSESIGREVTVFNVNSTQQLQWLLYEEMGLPDVAKSVNPKLQPRSTAAAVLEKLLDIDDRLKPLVDYREKEKLLNSFVRKFPEITAPDGRVHYQLNPWGTDTARYSSTGYGNKGNKRGVNIQQIPNRSKTAKYVRMLLIP